MGRDPTTSFDTYIRSFTVTPRTIIYAQLEFKLNAEELIKLCANLHTRIQSMIVEHRKQSKKAASKSQLSNFAKNFYALATRFVFNA